MAIGMVVLDEAAQVIFSSVLSIDLFANPGFFAPVMTLDMTVGMSVWMLFRRHTLMSIGEMSGAMVLPLCLLVGPHWAGMISGSALVGGSMALSLPAMVLVMFYRRGVYGQSHQSHLLSHYTATRPGEGHSAR